MSPKRSVKDLFGLYITEMAERVGFESVKSVVDLSSGVVHQLCKQRGKHDLKKHPFPMRPEMMLKHPARSSSSSRKRMLSGGTIGSSFGQLLPQKVRYVVMIAFCRYADRCPPSLVSVSDIGPCRRKQLNCFEIPVERCSEYRRFSLLIDCIHIRAMFDEK